MINFCCRCGAPTKQTVPVDDQRPRAVCQACGYVQYQNPKIVTCAIPLWQDKIMLCLRGIEPRLGYWTLPGGFMENGESCQDSAIRETLEETGAEIDDLRLQAIVNLPFCNQVHLFYRARLIRPSWQLTTESSAIELFNEVELPWSKLAFSSVQQALRHHFQLKQGLAPAQLETTIDKGLKG